MRYREHRIRTSLAGHQGRAPCEPEVITRLAESAYHAGRGVYFTEEQIAKMPWQARELIESEARRLYGNKRGARNG